MSLYLGITPICGGIEGNQLNIPFYFGQSMYSASEPKNASWLVSGGQWNSGTTYHDFYEWLLQIQAGTLVVSGVSVKLSTEAYDDYDYVINTGDTTFRLPLLNGEESLSGTAYEDLTLQASGSTYTALKNGILVLTKATASTGDKIVWLRNSTTEYSQMSHSALAGNALSASIELKKGQTGQYIYTADGATIVFRFIPAIGNGTLYFYVGETIQDANIIAAAGVLTDIADLKAHYITETYVNGTSWYRVYSDGWCEQGGIVSSVDYYNSKTISFAKTFSDTNYCLSITCKTNSNQVVNAHTTLQVYNYSDSQANVFNVSTTSINAYWRACGYIS